MFWRKLAATYPDTVEYFTLCHRCPQNHLAISNIIVADAEKQYSEREMVQLLYALHQIKILQNY